MKRILLTGASSYLGTKFVELYGDQFEILGLSRTNKNNPVDLLNFDAVGKEFNKFQPDFVLHTSADIKRDGSKPDNIIETDPAITKNLVNLAKENQNPFIFTSTEAVYGGKEEAGEYSEDDGLKPRSPYGESKVESEKIIKESGLPYLITRGHRYVGISKKYHRPKQFPDTLNALLKGSGVHLDSNKLFRPTLINDLCNSFAHYISSDLDKSIIINQVAGKTTTYFDFISDLAQSLGLDNGLIHPDGEETGWPDSSILSVDKIKQLKYPNSSYKELLATIKSDLI